MQVINVKYPHGYKIKRKMGKSEDIKLRVQNVIRDKGTNVNALANKLGIAQSSLYGQVQSGNFSLFTIEGLLRIYPDISPDWLVLGNGYMYRTTADQLKTTDQYYALVDSLTEMQRRHDAEIQAMIVANQRGATVNISNVGNTIINAKPNDDKLA